jgi:predicted  nucleic acid-binding Zn-ribbon protein
MKTTEKEAAVKDGVIRTYTPESEESRTYFNMLSDLRRENDRLMVNCRTHESAREALNKQIDAWKKQVVEWQAKLLAAQDQTIELQKKLLEFRQMANAPID